MAYKALLRFKGRCPNHPRYNPEIGGRGAVVGACKFCAHLCDLQQAMTAAQRLARGYDDLKPVSLT